MANAEQKSFTLPAIEGQSPTEGPVCDVIGMDFFNKLRDDRRRLEIIGRKLFEITDKVVIGGGMPFNPVNQAYLYLKVL